jgi:hypothetical protein
MKVPSWTDATAPLAWPQDKKQRLQLLQGAVDGNPKAALSGAAACTPNVPLLELLVNLPGMSAADVKLHGAMGKLPPPLIQRLIEVGCRANQRDSERGALLIHKVGTAGAL